MTENKLPLALSTPILIAAPRLSDATLTIMTMILTRGLVPRISHIPLPTRRPVAFSQALSKGAIVAKPVVLGKTDTQP